MHVTRVTVEHFRSIDTLVWDVPDGLTCLIGAGDAGKTSLLDAIEWGLWPRYSLPVSDADFFGLDTRHSIVIEVTVGGVPDDLLTDDRYAFYATWVAPDGSEHEEPVDQATATLTIRLTVDADLNPEWWVAKGALEKDIGWRRRAQLGVVRLGLTPEMDLRWGRGSALSRLTETDEARGVLAEAYRIARTVVAADGLDGLAAGRDAAASVAALYATGVNEADIDAGIDPRRVSLSSSVLALYDGRVPTTASGLGSRRLLSLALQQRAIGKGSIVLIDEVETGLEPHRLRRLLAVLRDDVGGDGHEDPGQIVLTTHSPTTVVELGAAHLGIVRAGGAWRGAKEVTPIPDDVQGLVRRQPDSLLATSILVCEGATEYGLMMGLDELWTGAGDAKPLAHHGVALVDGEGSNAAETSFDLTKLGYRVALLCDNDVAMNPSPTDLRAAGVSVFDWDAGNDVEAQLASDLPMQGLKLLLHAIADRKEWGQVRGDIKARIMDAQQKGMLPDELADWPGEVDEETLRRAVGSATSEGGWLKAVRHGKEIAQLLDGVEDEVPETTLAQRLRTIRDWSRG